MEFDDIENDLQDLSAADIAARDVDAINDAATEAGDEKTKALLEEMSGVSARNRFGVGPKSTGALTNAAQKLRTSDSFHLAALAQGYQQSITFNVGGRDVSMGLGDIRNVASDRYNHYGTQLRQLKSQGASQNQIKAAQKRMDAYRDLMRMTDQVARGELSPDELARHIEEQELGQEIADTALSLTDIKVEYTAPKETATAEAGQHAGSAAHQQETTFDAIFGNS